MLAVSVPFNRPWLKTLVALTKSTGVGAANPTKVEKKVPAEIVPSLTNTLEDWRRLRELARGFRPLFPVPCTPSLSNSNWNPGEPFMTPLLVQYSTCCATNGRVVVTSNVLRLRKAVASICGGRPTNGELLM